MALSKRRSYPGMFSIEYYAKDGEATLFRAQSQPIQPPIMAGTTSASR